MFPQSPSKISRLLIANRAEIARRIARSALRCGIAPIHIYSEADADALFVREAAESYLIGGAQPRESYLNIEKIVRCAVETRCEAVHPGYGFLSENSEFAAAVRDAGLIFVGPSPEAIRLLGSKTEARKLAVKAGVPVSPGTPGGLSDSDLLESARGIGFPVIIKAVAGGGGRGMRVANSAKELKELLPIVRTEVLKNFASSDLYLEKYLPNPRHIEVQLLGDSFGNVVHLGTRDCSVQRRHQKLIEEAPAPDLSRKLREAIHTAALKIASAAGYESAGTAEFLVQDGKFYFLEMNTRIQVEHPVTEQVTGIDLVEMQLRIAQGEKIPFCQKDVTFQGHAIEFRLNAEDPEQDFRPATGKIVLLERPSPTPALREEFGYDQHDIVRPFYDGLIGKVIISGADRSDAIAKSRAILSSYVILGVPTSLDYHLRLLENGLFIKGSVTIGFVSCELETRLGGSVNDIKGSKEGAPPFREKCLRDFFRRKLEELSLRDPAHHTSASHLAHKGEHLPVDGKNSYKYRSAKFDTTYTIEVVHRRDGFFLAVPVDEEGRRAPAYSHRRMSNGLDKSVQSLIDEVLETTPPSKMFARAQ